MKVAFVVNDLHLSGGINTVVQHAARLRTTHGFAVDLVHGNPQERTVWAYEALSDIPVRSFADAANDSYDVAVATWWETTVPLFEIPARRHAYFVQSLEDRFYDSAHAPHAFAASLTYELPVSFITEARWIAETLRALRPDASCFYVRNGIDKVTFPPRSDVDVRLDRPLRILVEGRPEVWFKGVDDALAATAEMTEPRHVTLVSPSSADAAADRVVGPLTPEELAAAYAVTDVVLKVSRVEGMYGPPLEGFHLGATCVTTPVTGHDEYVVHGWNGLIVDWDDRQGTAHALDLLARDRRLLHYLRTNAVATARSWPSWDQSTEFMALALQRIRRDAPPAAAAPSRSVARVRVAMEQLTAFAPPGAIDVRSALMHRLWSRPSTARLMRIASLPPIRRVLRPLVRRILG